MCGSQFRAGQFLCVLCHEAHHSGQKAVQGVREVSLLTDLGVVVFIVRVLIPIHILRGVVVLEQFFNPLRPAVLGLFDASFLTTI